jgi:hypothetical protein
VRPRREWAPEQPQQASHQRERKKRKRQSALAVKWTVKEAGIHVDAEPRDGHNPYRILEYGDGNDAQNEACLLPVILKESVLCQQTYDEQGQSRVNAAALFRDLDINPRQRKLEAVLDYGYSNESE